jgi:hypothetical protein
MSTMNNTKRSMALVGIALLMVGGCSGSKVTTKASAELSRYQIRTIALVPFTTLVTPQVRDVVDRTFSVPPEVRRSDISMGMTPHAEQPLRQTVTVPAGAGDIVTQLLWSRLKARQGMTAQGGCLVDRPSIGVSGTSWWSLWRQPTGDGGV